MSKYRGLNGTRLEQISHHLETSEELLDALETVSGVLFEPAGDKYYLGANIVQNKACDLWDDAAGREAEILAAIPTDSAEEDDVVNWGGDGRFAEWDGEKWVRA